MYLFVVVFQIQEGSPALKAGLEPFFDFILSIGNTRLVSMPLAVWPVQLPNVLNKLCYKI